MRTENEVKIKDEVLQLKKWIKDNPKIVKDWEMFKHGKK